MKLRNSKNYVIIGNIHLGWDTDILKSLATLAEEYGAQVIHTGNICNYTEKAMFERRTHKLRTFEKIASEKEKDLNSVATSAELERRDTLFNKLDTLKEGNNLKKSQIRKEIEILEEAETARIHKLKTIFPNIKFVANEEQYLVNHPEIISDKLTLSKHLDVHSVNANGDKVSSTPITDRAFRFLKLQKKSVIMPHPAPSLRSYERAGLNEAWNMYTTGCLFDVNSPKRPSEFYKATYLPSALLVLVDSKNGEYHASRLHFDKLRCDFAHKTRAAILHDGRCFTGGGIVEVSGGDTAVYSTDDHAPHENLGVLGVCRFLLKISKAETFINGGDAADWSSLCPHNKNNPRAAEKLRFSEDKKAFKRLLDAQSDSPYLREKVLIDANHEFWIERYVDEHPEMEGIIDQKTIYKELIPDWKYRIPKNGEDYTYYFGDLAIRHGHKESLSKATRLFYKYLAGHFHSHNEYLRCGSSGAGCNLGPKYLGGNLTKWQNCATVITRYKGVSAFDIKSVLHDKKKKVSRVSYQGKIYQVDFHKYKEGKK